MRDGEGWDGEGLDPLYGQHPFLGKERLSQVHNHPGPIPACKIRTPKIHPRGPCQEQVLLWVWAAAQSADCLSCPLLGWQVCLPRVPRDTLSPWHPVAGDNSSVQYLLNCIYVHGSCSVGAKLLASRAWDKSAWVLSLSLLQGKATSPDSQDRSGMVMTQLSRGLLSG